MTAAHGSQAWHEQIPGPGESSFVRCSVDALTLEAMNGDLGMRCLRSRPCLNETMNPFVLLLLNRSLQRLHLYIAQQHASSSYEPKSST